MGAAAAVPRGRRTRTFRRPSVSLSSGPPNGSATSNWPSLPAGTKTSGYQCQRSFLCFVTASRGAIPTSTAASSRPASVALGRKRFRRTGPRRSVRKRYCGAPWPSELGRCRRGRAARAGLLPGLKSPERSQCSNMEIHLICEGIVTPERLPPRTLANHRRASYAEGTAPAKTSRAHAMVPHRPLPALQWMTATLSPSARSQASTSEQKSSIILSGGGLWSKNGYRTVSAGKPFAACLSSAQRL
mmetsp:Transcript_71192/g.189295  ORF Transcript_71192/g.189295 Transcript_71192/m.189295 type:complete len:244 (-) Transcript_71192:564-1295(-)